MFVAVPVLDPAFLNLRLSILPAAFAGLLMFCARAEGVPPQIKEFISNHCTDCHDAEEKKGGIDLESMAWKPEDRTNYDRWVKIHDVIRDGEMPPRNRTERPEAAEQAGFLKQLGGELTSLDAKRTEGGRTVLRRLNRMEYERTLQDLLGIKSPLARMLPADTPMHGFDTVAEGLRFSTLQMEKYLEAADAALDAAIRFGPPQELVKNHLPMKENKEVRWHLDKPEGKTDGKGGAAPEHRHLLLERPDGIVFFNEGYPSAKIEQPKSMPAGKYRIRVSGYGFQSNGQTIPMRIYGSDYKDKQLLGWFEMTPDKPRVVDFVTDLKAGDHLIIAPMNTGTDKDGKNVYFTPVKQFTGPGLVLQWVEIEGPLEEVWPSKGMVELFDGVPLVETSEEARKKNKNAWYELKPTDAKADARRALEHFAQRAFRRPLEAGEVDRYIDLVNVSLDAGKPFVESMRVGFRAVLTAPQFLFFQELKGQLDEYALASRLSYFLWSRMPDEELMRLAAEKKLSDPAVLVAQVERMLKDGRSAAFVEDFTGQWLDLRNINATSPDEKLYPESDELLLISMVEETKAYFAEMIGSNLPVSNAVSSDFAMLNSRLADHYEIPGVDGETMRKVKLPEGSVRGGFLTQASILKITANGTTTSPVLRGAWVMKRILGRPPSPPPPGVGSIEPDTRGATTVREQLAKHSHSQSCAGCHAKIDPPGFALESFDVIGGYRAQYRSQGEGKTVSVSNTRNQRKYVKLGQPVDASGEFDGKAFVDINEFKRLLLDDGDQVTGTLAGKLVTYATGAGIGFADRAAVEDICAKTKEQGGGLRTLIHQIVASRIFQTK